MNVYYASSEAGGCDYYRILIKNKKKKNKKTKVPIYLYFVRVRTPACECTVCVCVCVCRRPIIIYAQCRPKITPAALLRDNIINNVFYVLDDMRRPGRRLRRKEEKKRK